MFTVEKIVVNISAIQWDNFGKLGRKNPFQYRSLLFLSLACVCAHAALSLTKSIVVSRFGLTDGRRAIDWCM